MFNTPIELMKIPFLTSNMDGLAQTPRIHLYSNSSENNQTQSESKIQPD